MRRRKLLISIGALAGGGTAAFGTEAFTSIQAERSVDVSVAGDQSAYLALSAADGQNANRYVTQTGDGNVLQIDLDGDNSGSGGGVNDNAVTKVDDLFRVLNQGPQPVNVYFEDDSDAVTFRVSRSTDTETAGAKGQSLEGADNSVQLETGEQVVVGLTIDTLNNDASGTLLDDVTIHAEAGAAAPRQSVPEPQYVVDGAGDSPNTFATLSAALASSDVGTGTVVGIEGSASITESEQITVSESVTITGFGGTPTVDATAFTGDGGAIDVTADDVTLRNFELKYRDVDSGGATNGIEAGQGTSGLTVDGLTVSNEGTYTGQPAINAEAVDGVEITNNDVSGGAIGVYYPSGAASGVETISNNYVNANPGGTGSVTEGIFVYGAGLPSKDLEVRGNLIDNHGTDSREIKLGTASSPDVTPATVNSLTNVDDQFNDLLVENDVNTVQIAAGDGVIVDPDDGSSNVYGDIATGISEAGADGYVLVRDGTYAGMQVDQKGVTVEAAKGVRPTIDASVGMAQSSRIVNFKAAEATIRGFEVVGNDVDLNDADGAQTGVTVPPTNVLVEDMLVRNVVTGVQFSSGSGDNTARYVTVENAQVGASAAGGTGHLVEKCDFTGLISGDFSNSPEGLGAAGAATSRNNNYGEDVYLRSYSNESLVSDGDFFGTNGEDGEVVATDGDLSDVTVKNVTTSPNEDAGVQ